jgi:hypothetical protein
MELAHETIREPRLLPPTVGAGRNKGHRPIVQSLIMSWLKGEILAADLKAALEAEHVQVDVTPYCSPGYLLLGFDYEQQVWVEVK